MFALPMVVLIIYDNNAWQAIGTKKYWQTNRLQGRIKLEFLSSPNSKSYFVLWKTNWNLIHPEIQYNMEKLNRSHS